MSNRSFMLGKSGPYIYDPDLNYRGNSIVIYGPTPSAAHPIVFTAKTDDTLASIYQDNATFETQGFLPNDIIYIGGTSSNDGYYLVASVEEDTIEVHIDMDFTAESMTSGTIVISTPGQAALRSVDVVVGAGVGDGGQIWDADGDTGVQTEEATDEDKIRMDTGGVERVVIDSSGTEIKNALNHSGSKVGFYNVGAITQQAHIPIADGTLADVTSKFNTLLLYLENLGLIAST